MRNVKSIQVVVSFSILASTPVFGQVPSLNQTPQTIAQNRGLLSNVFGCDAPGSKQIIGAAAGGALGGLIGNRVVKGSRAIGTIGGAAIGASAGSWLGCKLQRNDQRRAQQAAENAASQNAAQQWSNPDTGASGTATPIAGQGLAGLNFPKGITPASEYTDTSGLFTTAARTNLRSGASQTSPTVGVLNAGEKVIVSAGVANSPWMLVSSNGVARGYVSSTLLRRAAQQSASGCRYVRQTISTPANGVSAETLKACPDSNGSWVLSKA